MKSDARTRSRLYFFSPASAKRTNEHRGDSAASFGELSRQTRRCGRDRENEIGDDRYRRNIKRREVKNEVQKKKKDSESSSRIYCRRRCLQGKQKLKKKNRYTLRTSNRPHRGNNLQRLIRSCKAKAPETICLPRRISSPFCVAIVPRVEFYENRTNVK